MDSNVVIYAVSPDHPDIRQYLNDKDCAISIISQIEVLGYRGIRKVEEQSLLDIMDNLTILPLTNNEAWKAIQLRKNRKMGLGDAIIAATALIHGLPLATRNVSDFQNIPGLKIIDPLSPDESP